MSLLCPLKLCKFYPLKWSAIIQCTKSLRGERIARLLIRLPNDPARWPTARPATHPTLSAATVVVACTITCNARRSGISWQQQQRGNLLVCVWTRNTCLYITQQVTLPRAHDLHSERNAISKFQWLLASSTTRLECAVMTGRGGGNMATCTVSICATAETDNY